MRRLAALLLLVLSACAAPRARQKMSFAELYAEPGSPPAGVEAGVSRDEAGRGQFLAKKAEPLMDAPASMEFRAALAEFATLARAARTQVKQGSAMPRAQVDNWRQMNATLDAFLRQSARKTSSLDVVRARVTLEAELEQDARTYGDIPSDLADAVLARMELLAVRMAELRHLQLKPSKKPIQFAWPVDPVVITSVFGVRVHPITGEEKDHQGLDLAAKRGQLVSAAARGVVVRAGWNGGHGNQVVIQHDGDVTTRYSHLSRVLVTPGEVVEQGDVVGAAGKTGLATGVHLHFEIWHGGEPSDPLDEMGPTDSGEEPAFVQHEQHDTGMRKGRRPMLGRRPR
ncbi:M23 family metallopeptidase [Vitiosangium sp. GDMCC 1.1324]|uniref:M23 family metallopeptidase n=1 Tax=Vitiosangium sp. (strain GDMCC 1.1324) TaxID=2138576 RepID=UPI000D3AC0CA|nr:M23 family metallopeptidase [Vitiosangium sp. GDMCC 1.1324]PTL79183.1 M23 family peptidase [Vitiosangium sp. GDMCC 1.1324]